jgi:hypothetical protein
MAERYVVESGREAYTDSRAGLSGMRAKATYLRNFPALRRFNSDAFREDGWFKSITT